jgi:phosphoglycerol transferase
LFINPQTNPDRKDRAFSSFDMAPTILESMGFHLKDSKMGIGTSLYSTKPTLIEKIGIDSLNMALKDLRQTQKYIDLMIH